MIKPPPWAYKIVKFSTAISGIKISAWIPFTEISSRSILFGRIGFPKSISKFFLMVHIGSF